MTLTSSFGAYSGSWTPRGLTAIPKTSLVSDTSVTDSTSLTGSGLDTGLSSTLQSLATTNSALDTHLGSWVSSGDLADYLGVGSSSLVIPATDLIIRVGEDPEAWLCIPDGETSSGSQTVANLDSSSWVLLDDLTCGLAENSFVSIQSVLIYQQEGSSDVTVYVSFADPEYTSSTLPLDYTLDSFLYTDITGVSSDPGLGNGLDTATPPSENLSLDSYVDVPTQAGSETDLLAPNGGLSTDANLAADSTSDLSTSTFSSLDLDTDRVDSTLDSSLDVGVASGPSGLSGLGVSDCP
jgi:hypothetical protein